MGAGPGGSAHDLCLGQLSRLTGLAPEVIRAWERRYGFPNPQRTAGGHRRYSREEATLLHRAALLNRSGFRARDAVARARSEPHGGEVYLLGTRVTTQPDQLHGVLCGGDVGAALSELRGIEAMLGFENALEDRILPALARVGEAFDHGPVAIAETHVATGVVESWLAVHRAELAPLPDDSPRVLIGAPKGERHGVGLVALEVLLRRRSVAALTIGVDLPSSALVAAVRRWRPAALVLSVTSRVPPTTLRHAVAAVAECVPAPPVFVGGPAVFPLDGPGGATVLPDRLTDAADALAVRLSGEPQCRELRVAALAG